MQVYRGPLYTGVEIMVKGSATSSVMPKGAFSKGGELVLVGPCVRRAYCDSYSFGFEPAQLTCGSNS